jgi:polyhydroxyalkanoate synthase
MLNATVQAPEYVRAIQDELWKDSERWSNWMTEFMVNPADPPMAQTPKDTVWRRGKITLNRYRPQTDSLHPLPYLMVPWLGISRPYILDMLPGHSMVEYLVQQGHDLYMLDWGEIAEEDKDLGLEDVVFKILPRAIDEILALSGADHINLNGFCLGGVISNCYLALHPDAPVKNYISIVTPVDFDQGGLFKVWLGHDEFPVDLIVEHFGGIPPHLMGVGFKMLRPTGDMAAYSGLWMNMNKKDYIQAFKAMNHWANDFVGMPGRFFNQLQKEFYFENKWLKGDLRLKGQRVNLKHIRQPMFVAAASKDHIVPPRAAQALMDAVSSTDKEYVELPGGHISVFSGRQANKILWPRLHAWVLAHSGHETGPDPDRHKDATQVDATHVAQPDVAPTPQSPRARRRRKSTPSS